MNEGPSSDLLVPIGAARLRDPRRFHPGGNQGAARPLVSFEAGRLDPGRPQLAPGCLGGFTGGHWI